MTTIPITFTATAVQTPFDDVGFGRRAARRGVVRGALSAGAPSSACR